MKKPRPVAHPRIGSQKKDHREPLFTHLGDATFPLDIAASTPETLQKHMSAFDTYIARLTAPPPFSASSASWAMDAETKALVARACLHRGVASALLGMWPQARQDFTQVVDLAAGSAEARTASLFLALAYDIDQGDDELATQEWTHVLEDIETRGIPAGDQGSRLLAAQAYASRARISARQEEYAQTLLDCDRALTLDPECAEAYSMRGAARSHLGQTAAALQDCTRAIELAGWSVHYYRRCLVYKQAGEYARAFDDSDQACQMEPDNQRFQQERTDLLLLRLSKLGTHTPSPLPRDQKGGAA